MGTNTWVSGMCCLHADTLTRLFSGSNARGSGNLCSARTVYRTKTEQGENAYVYLLDEAMQMDKIGLISTNLAEKIAMTVTESPYRVTAETISNTCGQSISSGGVWNMMWMKFSRGF